MIKNIFWFKKNKSGDSFQGFIENLQKIYQHAPSDFGGGCSFQKALTLAFFIKEFKYQSSIDIGVYRGRSLFPQAFAHRDFTKGIVYAVDPYDQHAALQNDREDIKVALKNFAEATDFNKIFEDVKTLIRKFKLSKQTKFVRLKSHDAINYFLDNKIKLGLIHIDGNHDTKHVMEDINDYLPVLKDNGTIVLDDISWVSVKPAFNLLKQKMLLIGTCIDRNNDFAVFMKKENSKMEETAKSLFEKIMSFDDF